MPAGSVGDILLLLDYSHTATSVGASPILHLGLDPKLPGMQTACQQAGKAQLTSNCFTKKPMYKAR